MRTDEFRDMPHNDKEGFFIKPMRQVRDGNDICTGVIYSVLVNDSRGGSLIYREQTHERVHALMQRYMPDGHDGIVLDDEERARQPRKDNRHKWPEDRR